jgi:hypothetical protein
MIQFSRPKVRKAVQRVGSQRYMLFVLLSFAGSVSITRLFLSLTGYPKIGTGELHIAHVLWGGLILFIATLIPLLFANRWAYILTSFLSGVGIGLFIDEVGKFITQSNNYFYPAAAPIVYGLFMLTVLVYTQVRRHQPHDVRTELYAVFDELQEILDFDLDEKEHARILAQLDHIRGSTDQPDLIALADSLENFINSEKIALVPGTPGRVVKSVERFDAWAAQAGTKNRLKAGVVGGLIALGIWSLAYPVRFIFQIRYSAQVQFMLADLVNQGLLKTTLGLHGFELRLGLELAASLIYLSAAGLITFGQERRGLDLGYIGLVFSLAVVDMVVFYFNQFTTIVYGLTQAAVLISLLYYRYRFTRR